MKLGSNFDEIVDDLWRLSEHFSKPPSCLQQCPIIDILVGLNRDAIAGYALRGGRARRDTVLEMRFDQSINCPSAFSCSIA